MKEWAIFYAGGKVVRSGDVDGDPSRVPKRGVLAVVSPNENGQRVRWLRPYYIWRADEEEFYEASPDALWFYLADPEPGWKVVLFGEYVSDKEMNDVLLEAGKIYKGQKTWTRIEKPENSAWR